MEYVDQIYGSQMINGSRGVKMTGEQMQEAVRLVIEETFNRGNFTVLEKYFDPDFIDNQFGMHATIPGMQRDIEALRASFPNFHVTIDEMIANGDRVWARSTARATHSLPFMGPPTGKSFAIIVFDELRFANGKIVEHWGSPDRFAMLAQLGLLPKPAETRT